jgi:hypothetical protein
LLKKFQNLLKAIVFSPNFSLPKIETSLMKKFFEHTLTLIGEGIILILSILWLLRDGLYEPLIGIVGAVMAIIVTIFFKLKKEESEKGSVQNVVKGKNFNNNTIIQGNSGTLNINPQPKTDEKD